MARAPKPPISPVAFTDDIEVRRRVGRACHRCRLKKCKCDGATPCTRCKSDNAICAYGKPKRTDKVVFRSGYVQMLERQQVQLVAGLQELYRRMQNGEGWTAGRLELERNNQPLTHKILDALGVLTPGMWAENGNGHNAWEWFEKQGSDDDGCMYSESGASSTQTQFSPTSPTQNCFPQSTIMSKRRSMHQTDLVTTTPPAQTLSMPPPFMAGMAPIKPEGYTYPFPTPEMTLSATFPTNEQMAIGLAEASKSMTDWSFGMDDLLGNLGVREPSVQGCLQH